MEIKTSNEIIEMMEEADNAEAITDGTRDKTFVDKKWVAVDGLIKNIEGLKKELYDNYYDPNKKLILLGMVMHKIDKCFKKLQKD